MATDNNHPLTSFSWPFLITFGNNGEIEREREREREEVARRIAGKTVLDEGTGWKFERQRPAKLVSFEEKMSRGERLLHGRVGIEECRREGGRGSILYNGGQRSFVRSFVRSPNRDRVHGIS